VGGNQAGSRSSRAHLPSLHGVAESGPPGTRKGQALPEQLELEEMPLLPLAPMRSRLRGAIVAAGCVLVIAVALPAAAATGSWSPRAGVQPVHLWTRARLTHVQSPRAEIAPTRPASQRPAPPCAANNRPYLSRHFFSAQQPARRPPSSERTYSDRTLLARPRTSGLPDRRAHSAALAALAGIFHEAHAPPSDAHRA
jgi:hypothetical protein